MAEQGMVVSLWHWAGAHCLVKAASFGC